MILTLIRLQPFGCFADKEVSFAPGLNVVLGPNEAGKSTLFAAVKSSFLRARLTKPKFQELVARYLPVTGGDAAVVELELLTAEGAWKLRRRWGESAGSVLVLPSGGSLSDEDAISARLEEALPAKKGTFWWVLLTGQAELAGTVATLKEKGSDALADLSDLLRKAAWEAGGVSVERFLTRLKEREEHAFSQWDRQRGGPKDNRGIDRPWKTKVGDVLEAWYGKENARAAWKAAAAFETGLDEVNAKLRAAAAALAEKEAFLAGHAEAARGARERRPLEAEHAKLAMEVDRLRQVSVEWPVASHTAAGLADAAEKGAAARAAREKELHASKAEEDGRLLRERWARVQKHSARVAQAEASLASGSGIDAKAMEEIRRAASAVQLLQAGRDAGRLSLVITAASEMEILVQADLGIETRRKLQPGETATLGAERSIRITHPDMSLEARTGGAGDGDGAAAKIQQSCRELDQLLERSGASDLAEAEAKAARHSVLAAELKAARASLADELGAESLDALRARVDARGPEQALRPSAVVGAELAALVAEGDARDRELAGVRKRLAEWESAYRSAEALIDRFADCRRRQKDIEEQLARCAPIPEGYAEAAELLRAMDDASAELTGLKVEVRGLEERKRALEEKAPERTAAELAQSAKDAEEELARTVRRSEALERVRRASERLLADTDSALYSSMRTEMDDMVRAMTGGRHPKVEMEGSLPRALPGPAGANVGWELLSAGTKDTLALALRLAMASHFLAGSDGFMMMDDPLVEMDPARQAAAARALASFAERWQLILFTCHPGTAKLLGGNLIEL